MIQSSELEDFFHIVRYIERNSLAIRGQLTSLGIDLNRIECWYFSFFEIAQHLFEPIAVAVHARFLF